MKTGLTGSLLNFVVMRRQGGTVNYRRRLIKGDTKIDCAVCGQGHTKVRAKVGATCRACGSYVHKIIKDCNLQKVAWGF